MAFGQTAFFGDVNLGLYARATEKFVIVGNFLSHKIAEKIHQTLKAEVFRATAVGSDLAGIFLAANSNGIVLPWIIFNSELEFFKSLQKDFGLNVVVLKTRFTALGNLILCNDRGVFVSKVFSQENRKRIADALGVEAFATKVAGFDVVGACGVATNRGCLLHRDSAEKEVGNAEKVFGVRADIGTLNFGSPFVGGCIVANSKGALTGLRTTGPEIARAMEALGFV